MSSFGPIFALALVYLAIMASLFWRHAAKAKRSADESEAKFERLFEDAPVAFLETDLEGMVRRVNQKMCDLRGLTQADILGKHYADFAADNDRERIREEISRKLAGEAPLAPEKQNCLRKNGEIITVEVHETLLRDAQDAIVGLRSAALDVSEHTRKEEEIWRTTGELR